MRNLYFKRHVLFVATLWIPFLVTVCVRFLLLTSSIPSKQNKMGGSSHTRNYKPYQVSKTESPYLERTVEGQRDSIWVVQKDFLVLRPGGPRLNP